MLRAISSFSTGRRSKFGVIAVWVILGFALGSFQPKLQEATTNENEAFLPESADSTKVINTLEDEFASGREVPAIVVYQREGGLTRADRQRIAADASAACEADLIGLQGVISPFSGPVCGAGLPSVDGNAPPDPFASPSDAGEPPPETFEAGGTSLVSEDGSVALLVVSTNAQESEQIQDNVTLLREIVPEAEAADGELTAYVSGIAGIVSDSIEVFESIDITLLLVTITLVLTLLLAIYRSPVIAFVPLIVVGIAYSIAAAATYGLVEAGVFEVNGQTTALLIVLMFGAGTDYALLIVARFREELRQISDKHEAMARATERTAPAILSAGGTVFAAMLVLTLADLKSTQTLGPVLALGIGVMLLAGLTLLPAILATLGRGAFWPARPQLGEERARPSGIWRRIGHFVHDRPVFVLVATVAFLALGSLGTLQDRGSLDFGEGFRSDPDSVVGQKVIEQNLAGGATATTDVVVPVSSVRAVTADLNAFEGVDSAQPVGVSDDGELALVSATLEFDPFSDEATELIPDLRETVEAAVGESGTALVGGATAESRDTAETLRSDAKLIVPLILLLIFLILIVLLRAVVAPAYLVATVVLSFLFALGASNLIFTHVFDQPAGDPGLPTFAFIFLVALGVDYNIFLISRIREEAAYQETKEAVITGLEWTGGVITSAGLILAGTFSALMALPLEAIFQLGFIVAFGLLVDTFIVRTLLVPAIAFKLGERNWWPGSVSHGGARPDGG